MRVEVDGRVAAAEQLAHPVLVNYGHFTAMQVRDRRVRGLDLHLRRLADANQELFGSSLDGDLVRARIRHALGETADASVRVQAFRPGEHVSILVAVNDPVDMPEAPRRLMSVPYQRPVAHLKHVGGFGQAYHRRLAEQAGCHEALLTGADGQIAEGAITNIGFFDGDDAVWPAAPSLPGITMQLLQRALGPASRRAAVALRDLTSYQGAFICNSWGVAPVERIDDTSLPLNPEATEHLITLYRDVPGDLV